MPAGARPCPVRAVRLPQRRNRPRIWGRFLWRSGWTCCQIRQRCRIAWMKRYALGADPTMGRWTRSRIVVVFATMAKAPSKRSEEPLAAGAALWFVRFLRRVDSLPGFGVAELVGVRLGETDVEDQLTLHDLGGERLGRLDE